MGTSRSHHVQRAAAVSLVAAVLIGLCVSCAPSNQEQQSVPIVPRSAARWPLPPPVHEVDRTIAHDDLQEGQELRQRLPADLGEAARVERRQRVRQDVFLIDVGEAEGAQL